MKSLTRWLGLAGAIASLAMIGCPTAATAQEARGGMGDRLERLEQRVNQLAERQEQFMRRLGAQMERQGPMHQPDNDRFRHPLPPAGAPMAAHLLPANRAAKGVHDLLGLLFLIGVICNILLAIWIFTDIRKRGEGSGIFIAMALVAGIPAALIYALTRIGDRKA